MRCGGELEPKHKPGSGFNLDNNFDRSAKAAKAYEPLLCVRFLIKSLPEACLIVH